MDERFKNRVETGDSFIEGVIEKEAPKNTLKLKANGSRGKLTSYTKIRDRIINAIPLSKEYQDSMTTTYNLDPNFVVDILTKKDYKEVEPINQNINSHTESSKRDDNRTGAGVLINNSHNDIAEEAIHLGNNATVFQAKVFSGKSNIPPTIYSLKSVQNCCHKLQQQLWLLTTPK